MSEIQKIDEKNFTKLETASTAYNVDDLTGQIATLNQRVAQIITNYQTQAQAAIQPVLDEIAAVQQLLTDAAKAGVVVTDQPVSDVAALLSGLDTLKSDAGAIASPPVTDTPVETPPIEEPVV